MDSVKDKLINAAKAKGICAEGLKRMLNSAGADGMVDFYIENPDWCLERDFPSVQILREHFADFADKGVMVNRKFDGETLNDLQAYVFHGCEGTVKVGLNVDKSIIPMLYIANGCELTIEGCGVDGAPCVVPVYIFGENHVKAEDSEGIKFRIFKQGVEL